MTGDIEVQDPAAIVFDHEETAKRPGGNGGNGKEIERDDHFPMVPQKSKPALCRAGATAQPLEISCHRSFGYDKAELLNFAVDSRRSPRRVLDRHAFDEIPHFPVDLRPPTPGSGAPAPIETKTGTVPADDRFRFHDDE